MWIIITNVFIAIINLFAVRMNLKTAGINRQTALLNREKSQAVASGQKNSLASSIPIEDNLTYEHSLNIIVYSFTIIGIVAAITALLEWLTGFNAPAFVVSVLFMLGGAVYPTVNSLSYYYHNHNSKLDNVQKSVKIAKINAFIGSFSILLILIFFGLYLIDQSKSNHDPVSDASSTSSYSESSDASSNTNANSNSESVSEPEESQSEASKEESVSVASTPSSVSSEEVNYVSEQRFGELVYTGYVSLSTMRPNGHGVAVYDNGWIYDGNWVNGKKEGQATCKWPDGRIFEGLFKPDEQGTSGIYRNWPDGNGTIGTYEGEVDKNEVFKGIGCFEYPNGDKFEGEFSENVQWNGTLYKNDGSTFKVVNGEVVQ